VGCTGKWQPAHYSMGWPAKRSAQCIPLVGSTPLSSSDRWHVPIYAGTYDFQQLHKQRQAKAAGGDIAAAIPGKHAHEAAVLLLWYLAVTFHCWLHMKVASIYVN
jgi:hypothetical protein